MTDMPQSLPSPASTLGGHMGRTAHALLIAAGLTLAACTSGSTEDPKPTPAISTTSTAAKLAPAWVPKLTAAAGKDGEAVDACQDPGSEACAGYVENIMGVVEGLKAEIDKSGRHYPSSLEQITKMTDAHGVWVFNACKGNPDAGDPNSKCHKVVIVTVGAVTLEMALQTDELAF